MPHDIELTRLAETDEELAAARAWSAKLGFPLGDDEPVHVLTDEGARWLDEVRREQGLDD